MTIAENWQEVEDWLSKHAPKVLARLPKGVRATDVAYVEKTWRSLTLPQELCESLAIHDGNAETFGFYQPDDIPLGTPLSFTEIVQVWRSLNSYAGRKAESFKGVKRLWWNRRWVPILRVVGDYTCIDMDPARGGKGEQVFVWVHDGGPLGPSVVAPSYGELFARFVQELKQGRYFMVSHRGRVFLQREQSRDIAQRIEQVERTVANPHAMELGKRDGEQLLFNIEMLWMTGQDQPLSLEPAKVKNWKAKYLATKEDDWDRQHMKPEWKKKRRAALAEKFDRLIALCRSQKG